VELDRSRRREVSLGRKPGGRRRYETLVVVGVIAVGFAWEMAIQAPSVLSAASAATIPQSTATSIGSDPHAPIAGNPVGSVTVSEFFDYRCPYCRMMQPTLDALVAKDRRVRLVAKEWPIFGGASVTAARVALASQWQGKYAAVHQALFKLPRTMDTASIREAATAAGVDMDRLDRDLVAHGREIDAELVTVDHEARALGFQGTPGFVVGTLVAPGAIPAAGLDDMVNRAAGK
jgi:protein-disulfide isomerase